MSRTTGQMWEWMLNGADVGMLYGADVGMLNRADVGMLYAYIIMTPAAY